MTRNSRRAAAPSERTTLRRKRERGTADREAIDAILDEGFICHVGFPEGGATVVLPTAYARHGDFLYLHGAAANRMLEVATSGVEICVTVTLVDGLVLARSAFHHSFNYRSVVVFGLAAAVVDPEEKRTALLAIVDHIVDGRSADARPPSASELRATAVVRLPLTELSAKVRTGGPVDDTDDLGLPIWAGVIPTALVAGAGEAEPDLPAGVARPAYVPGTGAPSSADDA